MLILNLLMLALAWIIFFTIISFTIIKKNKKDLIIKLKLWYLASCFLFIIGGLSLIEYLIFGDTNITNRWTLAVLSEENIYLFSSLWFISAIFFVIGVILSNSFQRFISGWNNYQIINFYDLNKVTYISFVLTLLSAIYENHFTLLKTERVKNMWINYELGFTRIDLPYKDIFMVYFALFLIWLDVKQKQKDFNKYLQIIFVITFIVFSILQGDRLIAIEIWLIWLIFNSWKNKGIKLKAFISQCILIVCISIIFYSFRLILLSLFLNNQLISFPVNYKRILSLLQADVGGHMYVTIKIYKELWQFPFDQLLCGSALLTTIINIIPRIINPWKSHTITYLFNLAYFGDIYEGGGLFMNIVSDGILNFGKYFFFIQSFLLGFFIGLFDFLSFSKNLFNLVLYMSCASIVIYATIDNLGAFLQVIIFRSIILLLIVVFSKLLK
jgi:hypothetical protein